MAISENDGSTGRIGIMGGTFDPIHAGHLILGECAYEEFHLDKVLFMPSGNPPHKPVRDGGATNEQRVRMVELAIKGNDHFELSMEEMHELGYIYTSKTLTRMTAENPGQRYFFILGADSLMRFETWREPETISRLCTLIVAVRDHMPTEELDRQIEHLQSLFNADIRKLSTPNVDVSSSMLREWIRQGRSCRYYLRDEQIEYIRREGIYGASSAG